jgi:hypothetical protein
MRQTNASVVCAVASLSNILGCVTEPAPAPGVSELPDAAVFFDVEGGVLKPPTGSRLRPRDQAEPMRRWQDAGADSPDDASSVEGGSRGRSDSSGSGPARKGASDAGASPRWIEAPRAPEPEGSQPSAADAAPPPAPPGDAGDRAEAGSAPETDVGAGDASTAAPPQTIGADEAEPPAEAEEPSPPLSPEVAVSAIVISEWLADPKAVSDADGEWLELFNASEQPVDLTECAIGDGTDQQKLEPAVIMAPGAYASVARAAAPGFTPDLIAAFSLTNSADVIELRCAGVVIDRIDYDKAQGWVLRAGAATALDPASLDASDNDSPESWCLATDAFGGDLGTPGLPNSACASVDDAGAAEAADP